MEDLQDTFIVHTIEEIQVCCGPPAARGPHPASPTPAGLPLQRGLRTACQGFPRFEAIAFYLF